MARMPQDVTDAELALLEFLWDRGPSTIRQLAADLYPPAGSAQYATVQKLLERLESKGYVERDRSASVHRFTAAVGRNGLIDRRLRAIADKLCGGSLTPLLTHLVQAQPLTDAERQTLREMIDRLAPPRSGGG